MKTDRRHELQTNTLADALGGLIEMVKPYLQVIAGVVLAVAVVFGVYRFYSLRSQGNLADGWNNYLRATLANDVEELQDITEQFAGTPAALWSNLYLGDTHLSQGIEQLFVNRAEANDHLRKAEQYYLAAQDEAEDPLLQQRATLGLARTYESLIELDKARSEYQALVEKWPDGAFKEVAARRLEDLSDRETREFYDWFAANQPKSPVLDGPGQPGVEPPFDINDLQGSFPLDLGPSRPLDEPAESPLPTEGLPQTDAATPPATQPDEPEPPAATPPQEPAPTEPNQPADGDAPPQRAAEPTDSPASADPPAEPASPPSP